VKDALAASAETALKSAEEKFAELQRELDTTVKNAARILIIAKMDKLRPFVTALAFNATAARNVSDVNNEKATLVAMQTPDSTRLKKELEKKEIELVHAREHALAKFKEDTGMKKQMAAAEANGEFVKFPKIRDSVQAKMDKIASDYAGAVAYRNTLQGEIRLLNSQLDMKRPPTPKRLAMMEATSAVRGEIGRLRVKLSDPNISGDDRGVLQTKVSQLQVVVTRIENSVSDFFEKKAFD